MPHFRIMNKDSKKLNTSDYLLSTLDWSVEPNMEKDRIVNRLRILTYIIHNWTLPRLQNDLMLFLDGRRYEIHTQKFEFGPEDFLAYIGGYLVSKWTI